MSQIQLVQEMDARLVEFNRPAMSLLVGIKNLFENFGRRPLDDEEGFEALFLKLPRTGDAKIIRTIDSG